MLLTGILRSSRATVAHAGLLVVLGDALRCSRAIAVPTRSGMLLYMRAVLAGVWFNRVVVFPGTLRRSQANVVPAREGGVGGGGGGAPPSHSP